MDENIPMVLTLDSLTESRDDGKMEYRQTRRVAPLSAFEILVRFMGLGREDFLDPIQIRLSWFLSRACNMYFLKGYQPIVVNRLLHLVGPGNVG